MSRTSRTDILRGRLAGLSALTVVPTLLGLVLLVLPTSGAEPLAAQGLKVAIGDVGLGIGPVPRIDGVRLNFRDDRRFERVRGINATIWSPQEGVRGDVEGLALGLPLTGADDITGLAVGAGIGVGGTLRGIALAPVGLGAGGALEGIMLGGIGVGAGGTVRGVSAALVGVGAGGEVRGLTIGGIGVGAGGSLSGVTLAGLGAGVGGSFEGIGLAGLGLGAGGSMRGAVATLGGVGVGGSATGLMLAGLGVGAGGHLSGIAIAGLGVGAPRITGLAAALGVGGADIEGLVLAPVYLRIEEAGLLRGVSVSAFNDVRGTQRGLVIGLLNIAQELHGVQIGLLNIAWNKDRFPVLPILNYHP